MPYSPPAGNAVNFGFARTPYTAPAGNQTNFAFGSGPAPPALQRPWHHIARFEEEEPEWRPPRPTFVFQPPADNKKKKHHVVLADAENAHYEEAEAAVVYAQRKFAPRALPVPHIKPYHHLARLEEPDPDWAPLIRGAAQGPLPTPPRQRPWHHLLWLDDAEPDPIPGRRQAAIAPLATPPRYRPWWHGILHDELEEALTFPARPAAPPAPVVVVQIVPWWRLAWREDEPEALTFPARPGTSAPAVSPVAVAAAALQRRVFEELDEPLWLPSRLPAAPLVAVVPPTVWHFLADLVEATADWLPHPAGAFIAPVTPPAPVPPLVLRLLADLSEQAADWLPHPAGAFIAVTPPPPAAGVRDTLFIANLGRLMNR